MPAPPRCRSAATRPTALLRARRRHRRRVRRSWPVRADGVDDGSRSRSSPGAASSIIPGRAELHLQYPRRVGRRGAGRVRGLRAAARRELVADADETGPVDGRDRGRPGTPIAPAPMDAELRRAPGRAGPSGSATPVGLGEDAERRGPRREGSWPRSMPAAMLFVPSDRGHQPRLRRGQPRRGHRPRLPGPGRRVRLDPRRGALTSARRAELSARRRARGRTRRRRGGSSDPRCAPPRAGWRARPRWHRCWDRRGTGSAS